MPEQQHVSTEQATQKATAHQPGQMASKQPDSQQHVDQRPAFAAERQMVQFINHSAYAQQQAAQQQALIGSQPPAQLMALGAGAAFQVGVVMQNKPVSGPADDTVVQRVATQVVLDDRDQIDHVIIIGRTPSPFGSTTMGGHSVAWVAITDAINMRLTGRTIEEAIQEVSDMIGEALRSPFLGGQYAGYMTTAHALQLREAFQSATRARRFARATSLSPSTRLNILQVMVNSYLNLVNSTPFATVLGASTHGDAEATARGALIGFENETFRYNYIDDDFVASDAFTDLERSIFTKEELTKVDIDEAPDDEVIEAKLREHLWALFAEDTIAVFARNMNIRPNTLGMVNLLHHALRHFFQTLFSAYPASFVRSMIYEEEYINAHLVKLGANVNDAAAVSRLLSDEFAIVYDMNYNRQHNTRRGGYTQTAGIQVIANPNNTVGSIIFEGRTRGPYSGMGAHSTAWVAHQDVVRQRIVGQTFSQAIHRVRLLLAEAERSPALHFATYTMPWQQRMIVRSHQRAINTLRRAVQARSTVQQLSHLQMLINDYLAFLNALPMSTTDATKTLGGREQFARPRLRDYQAGRLVAEYTGSHGQAYALSDLFDLFDAQTPDTFYDSIKSFLPSVSIAPSTKASATTSTTTKLRRSSRSTAIKSNQKLKATHQKEMDLDKAVDENALKQEPKLDKEEAAYLHRLLARAVPIDPTAGLASAWAAALIAFWHAMQHAYPRVTKHVGFLHYDQVESFMKSKHVSSGVISEAMKIVRGAYNPVHELPKTFLTDQFDFGHEFGDSDDMYDDSIANYFMAGTVGKILDSSLRSREQAAAVNDGFTLAAGWYVGHATGSRNACLIASLMQHALLLAGNFREPSVREVLALQQQMVRAGVVRDGVPIDVFSAEGRRVVNWINNHYHVNMAVYVLYNTGIAPVQVSTGTNRVYIYLAPGHYIPVWDVNHGPAPFGGGGHGGGGSSTTTTTTSTAPKGGGGDTKSDD